MNGSGDGVRLRIGLIVPAINRIAEPDFFRYAPKGVVTHTTRLRMTGAYQMPHERLIPLVAEAASLLADAGCDPIVFHCTSNAMAEGVAGDRRIASAIATATGRRVTTTATATLAALRALQARRIVVVSPYRRPAHEHEIEFLTEAGFEIIGERSLGLSGEEYGEVSPSRWCTLLTDMRSPHADAYFASCSNIRAIEVVEETEAILGHPVLTSNQVALWHALRLAGIDDCVPGVGRLLRVPAAVAAA